MLTRTIESLSIIHDVESCSHKNWVKQAQNQDILALINMAPNGYMYFYSLQFLSSV